MRIKVLFLIILIFLQKISYALDYSALCNKSNIDLAHINGVFTLPHEAKANLEKIHETIKLNPSNPLIFTGHVFYNTSLKEKGEIWQFEDLNEVGILINSDILEVIRNNISTIKEMQSKDEDIIYIQQILKDSIERIHNRVNKSPTEEDIKKMLITSKEVLNNERNIYIVAHSAGNLFLNIVFESLKALGYENRVKGLHIAPPTGLLSAGSNNYILSESDSIINKGAWFMDLFSNSPSPPKPNYDFGTEGNISGHNLIQIYLNQDTYKDNVESAAAIFLEKTSTQLKDFGKNNQPRDVLTAQINWSGGQSIWATSSSHSGRIGYGVFNDPFVEYIVKSSNNNAIIKITCTAMDFKEKEYITTIVGEAQSPVHFTYEILGADYQKLDEGTFSFIPSENNQYLSLHFGSLKISKEGDNRIAIKDGSPWY